MKKLEEIILQEFFEEPPSKALEKAHHKLSMKEHEFAETLSEQQHKDYNTLTFLEGDCDLVESKDLISFVLKFLKQMKKF